MSIKRWLLHLAGTTATAGTILAGSAAVAHATPAIPTHTLEAKIALCLEVGSQVNCDSLPSTRVVLTGTTAVARTVTVANGVYTGTVKVRYQMDASGVVMHRANFERLLRSGTLVAGFTFGPFASVTPGTGPSDVPWVGTYTDGGAILVAGATTEILS